MPKKIVMAEEAREISGGLTTDEHLDKMMNRIENAATNGERNVIFKYRNDRSNYNEWANAVRLLHTKYGYTFNFEGEQNSEITQVKISW